MLYLVIPALVGFVVWCLGGRMAITALAIVVVFAVQGYVLHGQANVIAMVVAWALLMVVFGFVDAIRGPGIRWREMGPPPGGEE